MHFYYVQQHLFQTSQLNNFVVPAEKLNNNEPVIKTDHFACDVLYITDLQQ